MMQTPLCRLLEIDLPVIQAPFGPWDQVKLAAAVSEAGGLGSLGTALWSVDQLRDQWKRLRELTDRPFAVNHTGRPFGEEAFAATLEAAPKAISFHMGVVPELVARAHDHGIVWLQTVNDVPSAEAALEAGVDVLVAQGAEAGGNGGWVASLVLVPAVVDVAGDVPVVAAGGIADGRGLAAALALGAQGAWLGTRFLATEEMTASQTWKDRVVAARATDAVKVVNSERVLPPFTVPQIGEPATPRALRTALIDQLADDPESVGADWVPQIVAAFKAGHGDDNFPFAGQSVELIHEILPAAEIVRALVLEAEKALAAASSY